jgi:uncharacterized protein
MADLRFEWDPAKSALNQLKHGVSFLEATTVFEDDDALWIPDPDHSVGEERFVIVGVSDAARLLVVIHCEHEAGDVIRIISARRANRMERHTYAIRSFG